MLVAIYVRYSSKNQKELSVEGQIRECKEYCKRNSFIVTKVYVDRAQTGKNELREEFQLMMADAYNGRFDAIVVYKLSRFFRNRTEAAIHRKELKTNGVDLYSVTEQIPTGRGGIYYEAILEAEAEAYSVGLAEDTMRGMYDAAHKCQVTGPLPLGYKALANKKISIEAAGAEIVRQIFDMYEKENSADDICAVLNNQGIKTKSGHKFRKTSIYSILRNEKYKGYYKYKGELIDKHGCPTIIEPERFDRVQELLKLKKGNTNEGQVAEYMLSGKIFCGICGKPMMPDTTTKQNGARYHYYCCSGRRKGYECKLPRMPKDVLEKKVYNKILKILTDENIEVITEEKTKMRASKREHDTNINRLQKQIERLDERIYNILEAISQGVSTKSTMELLEKAEEAKQAFNIELEGELYKYSSYPTKGEMKTFLKKACRGKQKGHEHMRRLFETVLGKVYLLEKNEEENCGFLMVLNAINNE